MSVRGNSGYKVVDKRFGTKTLDTNGMISREQHYLERLNDRLKPYELRPPYPTVWLDAKAEYVPTTVLPPRADAWLDRSGNGINAVGPGPGSSDDPYYNPIDTAFNNLGSVQFDANDYMETSDNALLDCTDGFTVYIVTKIANYPTTYSFLLTFTNSTSWSQGWGLFYYSNNWRFFVNNWNNAATRVDMGSFTNYTSAHIFKLHYDKINIVGEIIGPSGIAEKTKAYTTVVTNPSAEGIRIADGNSNTYQINAKYGEILYYNSPLTAAEQLQAETYLKTKFNIS